MNDLWILALRGLLGGVSVCLFAAAGEVVQPKKFAGIFSAAPSVAVASLAITAATKGWATVQQDAMGMMAGAVGMAAYCAAAVWLLRRLDAVKGSAAAMVAWAGVTATGFAVFLR